MDVIGKFFLLLVLVLALRRFFFREDRLSLTSEKKVFKFQINLKRTDTFKRVLDNSLVVLRIRWNPQFELAGVRAIGID